MITTCVSSVDYEIRGRVRTLLGSTQLCRWWTAEMVPRSVRGIGRALTEDAVHTTDGPDRVSEHHKCTSN